MSAFMLRQGLHYSENRHTWTKAHMNWLASQKLAHAEQRLVFEEMMLAIRQAQERIERLEQAIRVAVPDWSLAEVVKALMAMRGLDLVSATTFLAEVGDLSRFATARSLMDYLGLVPSEDSTGDTVKRGPITKAGNGQARRMLVECACTISTRRGSARTSRRRSRPRRLRFARSPGRRSAASTGATSADQERQAQDRRYHRGRSRVRGLHLGRRPRGERGPCCGQVRRTSDGR